MRFTRSITPLIILALLVIAPGCATTRHLELPSESDAATPTFNAGEATEAVAALRDYRFGDSREPLMVVQDLVRDFAQNATASAQLAGMLASALDGGSTFEGKQFVCRQLAIIGGDPQVPALAALLADESLTDSARYALERIPGRVAESALIGGLATTSGTARIGVINSLGVRGTRAAVSALRSYRNHPDDATSDAARAALARIDS